MRRDFWEAVFADETVVRGIRVFRQIGAVQLLRARPRLVPVRQRGKVQQRRLRRVAQRVALEDGLQ